jgi:pimeloyl-ACP methyl ester carboxylesterase
VNVRVRVALAAVLLLTGCHGAVRRVTPTPSGSGATPGGPAATTPGGPASATPDIAATIARYGAAKLGWKGCGDGFECARLAVPLDYAAPAAGDASVSVIRLKARKKAQRIGSLVLNPGGPGGSGVEFARGARQLLPGVILDRFDTVSFDPRGVGESTPVDCLGDEELDQLVAADPTPDSVAERRALFDLSRDEALACQRKSGRVLPYVATVDAAKDMDVLRAVLGDDKLTYVGFSYGTLLGARYAEQFPGHIRALVLDGAVDPTLTPSQTGLAQALGFETALKAFLNDCAAQSCAFASHGPVGETFDNLMLRVEKAPIPSSQDPRLLGPSEFLFGVAAALYSREGGWPLLRDALESAWTRKDSTQLLALFDNIVERDGNGHYSNSLEAQAAISCVDSAYPRDEASYDADAAAFKKKAPRFGEALAYGPLACAYWPAPAVSRPGPVHAPGAPAVLVVGTTRDPATPYAWSVSLAKQLAAGLLTHEGDGHTAYGYGRSACVDREVDAYLVTLALPRAGTRCP